MAGSALVFVLLALAASWRSVFAAEYEVVADGGCSDSWTFACTYSMANREFYVGDILVFKFDTTRNTVAPVSEAYYSTCENGVSFYPEQMSRTSPTNQRLTSAEDYYFVSVYIDTNGNYRCFQKLHITVKSSPPTPPPPGAPSSTSPPPPSKSNNKHIIEIVGGSVAGVVAFSFKIWLLMYCVKKKKHDKLNDDQVTKIAAEAAKA